jgi:hypothetical protein
MTIARFRSSIVLMAPFVFLAALSTTSRADTIYLINGSVFEDVMVSARTEMEIRFRLDYGELSIPSSQVERVVEGKSAFEAFLEKRGALETGSAEPEEWLALAEWAEMRGLVYGYRELLEMLAKRAPLMTGLAPHMRTLGYELDRDVGAWARRRTVERTFSPREPAGAAPTEPHLDDTSVSGNLSRAVELMAEADLERARRETRATPPRTERYFVQAVPIWSTVVWTGWSFPQRPSSEPPPPADPNHAYPIVHRPSDAMARALLRRQPGSIIPLSTLAR